MKNKTEPTVIKTPKQLNPVWGYVIPTAIILLSGLVTFGFKSGWFKSDTKPLYDTCAKYQHLFAKGSGKAVVTVHHNRTEAGEYEKSTNTYCNADAPRYDRVVMPMAYDTETGGTWSYINTTFLVPQLPWTRVDENGERLDKPKPCQLEHVPQVTNGVAFTNLVWSVMTNGVTRADMWRWLAPTRLDEL